MKTKWYLAVLLVLSVLASGGACAAQTLRQAADKIGLLVGTAADPPLFSQTKYARTLASQYNMIEPEGAMKWRATEPSQGVFDFKAGDRLVAFAEAHGMKVRGHNLLWDKDNPEWLTEGHFTPAQLKRIMKHHIQTVVRHFRGRVFAWDVVNEGLGSKGTLDHSIWYDQPGIGLAGQGSAYIVQAFRWAHEADPHALLFYNEDHADDINVESDAMYKMVKEFRAQGVPIDGVGLQMHIFTPANLPSHLAENIARFAKLGVEVHITELDVGLSVHGHEHPSASQLAWQAKVYRMAATACAENPDCTGFQTWGFTDRYSWIPEFSHGKRGAALPFDANYKPKPAERAILDAFHQALKSNPNIKEERLQFEQKVEVEHH